MEHIEKGNAGEAQPLTVGVVGLGLIGGSFAKRLRSWRAPACSPSTPTRTSMDAARVDVGLRPRSMTPASPTACDLIVLAAYPEASRRVAARPTPTRSGAPPPSEPRAKTARHPPGPVVIDTAGVKRGVCERGLRPRRSARTTSRSWGRTPWRAPSTPGSRTRAPTSSAGAPMVLVPPALADIERPHAPRPRAHASSAPRGSARSASPRPRRTTARSRSRASSRTWSPTRT